MLCAFDPSPPSPNTQHRPGIQFVFPVSSLRRAESLPAAPAASLAGIYSE